MTGEQAHKLSKLQHTLRGTGLFCFEKSGTFMLYREVTGGRNVRVLSRLSIDEFVRVATRAAAAGVDTGS